MRVLDRADSLNCCTVLEADVNSVQTSDDWKEFRDRWLGRKNGVLTQVNDWLKAVPSSKRASGARRLNLSRKQGLSEVVENKQGTLRIGGESGLAAERIDVTLPGIRRSLGRVSIPLSAP